jgi:hypothetical protein
MLRLLHERLERMPPDRRVRNLRWGTGLLAGGAGIVLLMALVLSPAGRSHDPADAPTSPEAAALQSQLEQTRQERDQAQQRVTRLEQQIAEEAAINEALRSDLQQATARLRQKPAK